MRSKYLVLHCTTLQADVRAVSSGGLTPLHCLALYNAQRGNGDGVSPNEGPAPDNFGSRRQSSTQSSPTALVVSPPAAAAAAKTVPAAAAAVNKAVAYSPGTGDTVTATAVMSTATAEAAANQQQQLLQRQYQHEQRKLSVNHAVRAIADMLLDAGGDPEAVDNDGNTPLLTAAGSGGAALCELLIARGVNYFSR